MRKQLFVLFGLLVVFSIVLSACATAETPTVAPTDAPAAATAAPTALVQPVAPETGKVQIYWYIGLGAGSQPAQIVKEKAFIEKYNSTQGAKDGIQLIPIVVDNKYATDNLTAQIAAGNVPDIVGPVGMEGRASFPGSTWLDLNPIIKQLNYDVSKQDPALMDVFKTDGKQVGLPLTIYPSGLMFNKKLFDDAKLAYPPQKVGDKYTLNGVAMDWNFDTMTKVAKLLTIDKNGKNATEAGFDATKITQYGFDLSNIRQNPRNLTAFFEPYYPIKDGKADLSAGMRTGLQWFYDGMWGKEPFIPTKSVADSDYLGKGSSFGTGHIAMNFGHMWMLGWNPGALNDATGKAVSPKPVVSSWDVGVIPASPVDGKIHAEMHADTFAIMAASKHPVEAFKVYAYMVGEGAASLADLYGGLPVNKDLQAAFLATQDKAYAPNKITWSAWLDMISYADVPNHQQQLPAQNQSRTDWEKFETLLGSTKGLDAAGVDKAIEQFITDWNKDLAATAK